jgi:hypothetical protein
MLREYEEKYGRVLTQIRTAVAVKIFFEGEND